MKFTYQDIDVSELFKLPIESRRELVKQGVDLFYQQSKIGALVLNTSLDTHIDRSLITLELEMEKEQKKENYEMVWYYNEIIWGIHERRDGNWNI